MSESIKPSTVRKVMEYLDLSPEAIEKALYAANARRVVHLNRMMNERYGLTVRAHLLNSPQTVDLLLELPPIWPSIAGTYSPSWTGDLAGCLRRLPWVQGILIGCTNVDVANSIAQKVKPDDFDGAPPFILVRLGWSMSPSIVDEGELPDVAWDKKSGQFRLARSSGSGVFLNIAATVETQRTLGDWCYVANSRSNISTLWRAVEALNDDVAR